MGRGNVGAFGKYEGQYYIENEDYSWYFNNETDDQELLRDLDYDKLASGQWIYDDVASQIEFDDIIAVFKQTFMRKFPSFKLVEDDKWVGYDREQWVIMENCLFYIALEDNETSVAVELVQKGDLYGNMNYGFQKRHYQRYLDGIRDSLLEWLPEIAERNGPWTHNTIRKEDLAA